MTLRLSRRTLLASAAALSLSGALPARAADVSLLNVSYDPTERSRG